MPGSNRDFPDALVADDHVGMLLQVRVFLSRLWMEGCRPDKTCPVGINLGMKKALMNKASEPLYSSMVSWQTHSIELNPPTALTVNHRCILAYLNPTNTYSRIPKHIQRTSTCFCPSNPILPTYPPPPPSSMPRLDRHDNTTVSTIG